LGSPIERLLRAIRKIRVFTSDVLAQVLNMDKREVEAIIGVLLSQGKIRVFREQHSCNACPLSNICSLRYKGLGSKIYELVDNRYHVKVGEEPTSREKPRQKGTT